MKSIAELIWDEEQRLHKEIAKGIDCGNIGIQSLSHYNGIARGLQIARDIAEKYEHKS